MRRIIYILLCTLITIPSLSFAEDLKGRLFKLSNGDQYGIVSEMMFYQDGTYLLVKASISENSFMVDKGFYLYGNGLLFYTNKSDTTIGNIRWLTEDAFSITLTNGEQYIYEEITQMGANSPYLIPNIPHKIYRMKVCPMCHGNALCPYCDGTSIMEDYSDCTHCGMTSRCPFCFGTGKIPIK